MFSCGEKFGFVCKTIYWGDHPPLHDWTMSHTPLPSPSTTNPPPPSLHPIKRVLKHLWAEIMEAFLFVKVLFCMKEGIIMTKQAFFSDMLSMSWKIDQAFFCTLLHSFPSIQLVSRGQKWSSNLRILYNKMVVFVLCFFLLLCYVASVFLPTGLQKLLLPRYGLQPVSFSLFTVYTWDWKGRFSSDKL